MLTKTRAGIGLGVISLAAAFAYFSKPAEPPVAEPPGPFARYLQEVTERIQAQSSMHAPVLSEQAGSSLSQPASLPTQPNLPSAAFSPISQQSDLVRYMAGFSSPHVGVAATSYNNVYQALRDSKNPEEASQTALGMDWKTFVTQVDSANLKEQQEMSLKVNSLVNIDQGAAHLSPAIRCQLNADIQSLVSALQTRIDLREISNSPIGATDIETLQEERKRTFMMADMVRSSGPGCASSGLVIVTQP